MTGQGWKRSRDRVGIPTTLALGAEGIDQPEKATRGDRTRRHTRKSCLPPTSLPRFALDPQLAESVQP